MRIAKKLCAPLYEDSNCRLLQRIGVYSDEAFTLLSACFQIDDRRSLFHIIKYNLCITRMDDGEVALMGYNCKKNLTPLQHISDMIDRVILKFKLTKGGSVSFEFTEPTIYHRSYYNGSSYFFDSTVRTNTIEVFEEELQCLKKIFSNLGRPSFAKVRTEFGDDMVDMLIGKPLDPLTEMAMKIRRHENLNKVRMAIEETSAVRKKRDDIVAKANDIFSKKSSAILNNVIDDIIGC